MNMVLRTSVEVQVSISDKYTGKQLEITVQNKGAYG